MEMGAAVAGLDACRQGGNVLHGAGFVVHRHAGGQHGVLVHRGQEFLDVQVAVRLGQDLHHLKAFVFQRAGRKLHAGVFKPRDHHLVAPLPPGHGRAPDGHIVAFGAAAGEVDLVAAAVQRFGDAGPGIFDAVLGSHRRVVEAAGIGPQFHQRIVDDLGHRRVDAGGCGVVQIMKLGVGKHTDSSHFCTKLYRINYTRPPPEKQPPTQNFFSVLAQKNRGPAFHRSAAKMYAYSPKSSAAFFIIWRMGRL